MSNNEINIGDLFPPKRDGVEKFATNDSVVPEFIRTASYSPDETREQSIQKDWERLVEGLSDYVLAEQLTERELVGMGKPLAENYSEYFHTTLAEVKKNRKTAEKKLFKLIPRHSQLDTTEFFAVVREQNEKETEARERSLECYPRAGVEKMETKDVARKGLKKEAAPTLRVGAWVAGPIPPTLKGKIVSIEADKVAVEYTNGQKAIWPVSSFIARADVTTLEHAQDPHINYEATKCVKCQKDVEAKKGHKRDDKIYCSPCYDKGLDMKKEAGAEVCDAENNIIIEISDVELNDEGKILIEPDSETEGKEEVVRVHLEKIAAAKWKPGQHLEAKHNGAAACVVYVNEDDKTYVVKVSGVMYPSYYSFEDGHNTFDAVKLEDTKEGAELKSKGLS
jgi:hypothetical protein